MPGAIGGTLVLVLVVPFLAFAAAAVAAGAPSLITLFLVGAVLMGFAAAALFEIRRLVDLQ